MSDINPSVTIEIRRPFDDPSGRYFEVSVYHENREEGFSNREECPFSLTLSEQAEAEAKLAALAEAAFDEHGRFIGSMDDEPDDRPNHFASRREDDNAADAYFGHLGAMADRRAQ
jgi:hypothetical protein